MARCNATHGKVKQGSSILQPTAFGIDEHLEPGRHGATQMQDLVVLVGALLAVLHAFQERVVLRVQGCVPSVMNEISRVSICLTQIFRQAPHSKRPESCTRGKRTSGRRAAINWPSVEQVGLQCPVFLMQNSFVLIGTDVFTHWLGEGTRTMVPIPSIVNDRQPGGRGGEI